MKFGILSFDIANKHSITSVIEHAVKVEEAGLSRFWLGEHYGATMWANPEPLIPIILGMTERINVGSAGILMNLHSSYRVACSFKLMNSLFPGRVDLGVAKGSATEDILELMHDIQSGMANNTHKKVEDLFSFFNNEEEYFAKGITVPPYKYPAPNLWLLGLSYSGLKDALKYKSNFSRSLFHNVSNREPLNEELKAYTDQYGEKFGEKPKVNIAVSGVVGKSEIDAKNQHARSMWGKNTFILPNILAGKDKFTDYILQLNENYDVEEIIFLDLSPTLENKFETVELLGEIQASIAAEDQKSLVA